MKSSGVMKFVKEAFNAMVVGTSLYLSPWTGTNLRLLGKLI